MPGTDHELRILEEIERNPATTQATLAAQLGVAVGSVNFVVKRLVNKGYIHVKQLERRRLKYIITPRGLALRSKLAKDSLQYSMRLYRETRTQAGRLIEEVLRRGYAAVVIDEDSDLGEIVALTCLELHVDVVSGPSDVPTISFLGTTLKIDWPQST
jgi:DNA-binding MarR family transcriptional regulator